MRWTRQWEAIVITLVLGLGGGGLATAAGQTETDDARGGAVLVRALEALGGRERMEAVATWDIEGEGRENLSAEAQGLSPDEPTWRPHEERLGVDTRTLSVAWQRRTPRNDMSVRFRRFIYRNDASGFIDFVAGVGRLRPEGAPESLRRAYVRRVPHLLLLEAVTRATRHRSEPSREIDGRRHDVVSVTLPEDVHITLVLDGERSILQRAEYRQRVPTLGDVLVSYQWYGWTPDEALGLVPRGHRVEVDDVLFQEVIYSRFATGIPDTAALFEIPDDLASSSRPSTESHPVPPASLPASGEVAPGVHVAEVSGFVVMFIALADGVVALEAPEEHPRLETIPAEAVPSDLSERYVHLIRETVPGKPIRYVVASHHHSDHMGGLRAFAEASATVIVAPGHVSAARRVLGSPLPEGATIETVEDRRVLTDGERSIVLFNAGKNPHTDENLFVWLPKERIVFQGDLFYYGEGLPYPPPGRETMNRFFARYLHDRGIEPRAIYGVHNRGAAPEKLLQLQ